MTFDHRLVPMYEIGLEFTLNLWAEADQPLRILGCQNWSIILAMDVMAREACNDY